ncbi:MAG: alanine--tRNA ligase [Ruminococcus sp.]|nr:alanine--tRNA ligase [Ruminococcus sp.]
MQWTGLNELREKFLTFFESKGCLRLPSFSLVPKDDNSLLLINSGMAPMKKYFTGEITPPRKRVTTCQKCIRTPDIERVGITARHGTFFEMLGNFSFGDYFKREATAWAWEFFTKVLEMPEEKLYVSIYQDDDEAYDIWTKEVGVAPSHMVRLGKEDNFWEHGSGPCGPCSEIYFDRGDEHGCGKPDCHVGCECDRFVEVWNLVFTQFESDGKGNYTPLDHPNIDTGMGLERLACVMQNVDNLFLVDTVQNIMKHISRITGVEYGRDEKSDISLRVITDHIRSTTFMIGDGVMPSNEGKGYVLRRLLRRAARHGRLLGYHEPFLYQVCDTVIQENLSAYPELAEKREFITKVIRVEEESFAKTIDQGFKMLQSLIDDASVKMISGEDAFKLNDTYGFPIDLTREILAEQGIQVDVERFHELLKEQKKRSRDARKNAGADAWISDNTDLSDILPTNFVGYTDLTAEAKILAIIKDGERVETAGEGESVALVLDTTPFYAESGGQVGDTGVISGEGITVAVENTTKDISGTIFLHSCLVKEGGVAVGETLTASVDENRRGDIMRNHTAAHLLQAALREVLGTHVQQAGQLVSENLLRFDFTHFEAMTAKQLLAVEELVNRKIFDAIEVRTRELPIEEAKKLGAMALFGEKYGDVVRVVSAGDFSVEFCGGTHVDNTAKVGLFKIRQEGSVAAGVRRIEAVTGIGVLHYLNNAIAMITGVAEVFKSNPKALLESARRAEQLMKQQAREIADLNAKLAANRLDEFMGNAEEENGVKIVTGFLKGANADVLRDMCGRAKDRDSAVVAVIASAVDGKVTFAAACGKDALQKGANAGRIVKAVAQKAGGNGGGKPDMAMAGAKDESKITEALAAVKATVLSMLK